MTTIEDLRSSKNASGFRYVRHRRTGVDTARAKPFQAYAGPGGLDWIGPGRATAEESAQDRIDWEAGDPVKRLSRKRKRVRLQGRRPQAGRPDVLAIDGQVFVDLPPEQSPEPITFTQVRGNQERDFMLSTEFRECVANLPDDAIGEVKPRADLQSMKSALGAVLIEAYERDELDAPKYIIVGEHLDPAVARAIAHYDVTVLVP